MIELTQKLLAFYSSYFGQPYPFKKLDQLFVRYYDSEGMENPGLVTYDESMTILPYSSENHFLYIGYIIAHELAHQWHGGLVTMEWWDDVWLNESFADFLTTYTLRKINSSLSHPLISSDIFFRGEKIEAYEADERSTGTHPVHGSVLNTNVATSIFDRITYMKGASILKQLMFLIGEGNF
jgi:aminopeptidase N